MTLLRFACGQSRRFWPRLVLTILGVALLMVAAYKVEWRLFWGILGSLRWSWVFGSLFLGCCAMGGRALRLAWILKQPSGYGGVWRALALGYLGRSVLPLGGGELLKMRTLQTQLSIPAAAAASGAILDRLFDLLGVLPLLALLTGTGVALRLQGPYLWAGGGGLVCLVLGAVLLLWRRAHPGDGGGRGKPPAMLERSFASLGEILGALRSPAHVGRLLAAQAAVSVLDLAAIYVGLQAFAFGPSLPLLVSVRLSVYIMLSAALPLLPGGGGALQVACLLALGPAGVSTSGAFAYSLVAQGTQLGLFALLGGAAAFWPTKRLPY